MSCAAENPNRRLRLSALGDRVAVSVDRASFDDLVTMITSAPTWEKDRVQGVRILLRAIGEGKVDSPEDILSRWTWRLARATRKLQDRRAGSELPEAKRLLGALTNSRGHRSCRGAKRSGVIAASRAMVLPMKSTMGNPAPAHLDSPPVTQPVGLLSRRAPLPILGES